MFDISDRDVKRLESDLKAFNARALPFATRNTMNQGAFATMRDARENVGENMVERNRYTRQSIQVEQTRTLAISRQAALVGSTAGYMADQEFGATLVKRGSEGVAIPTSFAAGQGRGSQPRSRLPRKPNRMANIQLRKRTKKGMSRKQQTFVTIKTAAENGHKYVFLDLGRRKGIFKVTGGKRRPKIQMVHDLTRQSVTIPRNPWLFPAVERTKKQMPRLYAQSLTFQLKRLGIFTDS